MMDKKEDGKSKTQAFAICALQSPSSLGTLVCLMGLMNDFWCHKASESIRNVMTGLGMRRLGGADGTWVEEDDGLEAGILIVIDLQLLEGQDQLIKDANGHTAHLC